MTISIYMIAGEASGDALGAGLMRALKALSGGQVRFGGVGGERMEMEGLTSLFPYSELSLMGFAEIVPHLMHLVARGHQVMEDIATKRPDIVVTIDSPGFNFRIAEKLRKAPHCPKLVHYVAPSVWAYKPGRAKTCARLFDHLLCLLPFEPPFFEAVGLPTTFVGHPVAYQPRGDGARFREKYGIAATQPILCVMPGSRGAELKRHMPVFGPALVQLSALLPDMALAVPTSKRLLPQLKPWFENCPFRAVLFSDAGDKADAFAASTAALVKSGTSSLEVAQAGCAQVVAYKVHPLSAWLLKRMIRVPYASLVNLLSEEQIIPELIQEHCTAPLLAEALGELLQHPEARTHQVEAAALALAQLHLPGDLIPEAVAAEAVLGVLS